MKPAWVYMQITAFKPAKKLLISLLPMPPLLTVFECFLLFHCCFLGQNSKDAAGNPHAEWILKACYSAPELQNLECYQQHRVKAELK